MDRTIGKLLAQTSPDTAVIVVSDHGFHAAVASRQRMMCVIRSTKLLEFLGLTSQVSAIHMSLALI